MERGQVGQVGRVGQVGQVGGGLRDTGGKLLVALFVIAISLPLAANLAGVDGADPAAENRELAPFPRVDATWASIAAFPANLGLWFDDHFGFRSVLVQWYGESRLFVLGVSPSAAVVK